MSINSKGLVLNKFKYDETKDNLSNLYFHFRTFLYFVLSFGNFLMTLIHFNKNFDWIFLIMENKLFGIYRSDIEIK